MASKCFAMAMSFQRGPSDFPLDYKDHTWGNWLGRNKVLLVHFEPEIVAREIEAENESAAITASCVGQTQPNSTL